mgnify:CR=1 FL=1
MPETVNPIGGVSIKKLWAFNDRQRDHELIRRNPAYEKTKSDIGNSSVVRYSSVTKVTSNMRRREEHLFIEETIVTHDR